MPLDESNVIISELYDLVASPDQYDDFMVQIQLKLATIRSDGRSGEAGTIIEHMARAASLVDIVTPWRRETDADLQKALAQRMQATLVLDEAGNPQDQATRPRSMQIQLMSISTERQQGKPNKN